MIENLKMKYDKIAIMICVKDRPTELALLLQSLRTQSYNLYDIYILSDGCGTLPQTYYFLSYIFQRMKLEGHNIKILRNEFPSGVSKARQALAEEVMKNDYKYSLLCRLDDDVILEPNYLEKLIDVIEAGYDLASGVTTPFMNPDFIRETKFVEPIIGYCELDKEGNIIYMGDDCGMNYLEEKIIPSPHFRSCALYKRELHENGVDYNSRLSKNGFLEEAIFSFKAIIKGFKIGVNTFANARHLMTPSGGERDTMNFAGFNKQVFKETVKRMFEDNGDFLKKYYEGLGIDLSRLDINYDYEYNLMRYG